MAVDFGEEIKKLRATMDSVRDVTDLDKLTVTIADLEQQASAPDLWDDPDKAQLVTSALSRANSERDRVTGMDSRIDDLETLYEAATPTPSPRQSASSAPSPRTSASSRSAPC